MQHIHNKISFKTAKKKSLATDQLSDALRALMFLKEKRMGQIKGRMCADGRKQQRKSNKKIAISPTAATESVLITTEINSTKRRNAAVVDTPGSLLTDDMDK